MHVLWEIAENGGSCGRHGFFFFTGMARMARRLSRDRLRRAGARSSVWVCRVVVYSTHAIAIAETGPFEWVRPPSPREHAEHTTQNEYQPDEGHRDAFAPHAVVSALGGCTQRAEKLVFFIAHRPRFG